MDKVNLRWSAIRGQTRVGPGAVGQPTWWGCRVGGTSSYNPLNKADHLLKGGSPNTRRLIVDPTNLLSSTSALSLSLSVLSESYKEGRIVIMQRKLAATRAQLLVVTFH